MQAILDEAVAAYEDDEFWRGFSTGYDRLADDPGAWAEVQAERRSEASALADDLDDAS
jgi:hypothetical protein